MSSYLFDVFVISYCVFTIFFFKQKTAYEMRISDWSSDVCSSDLRKRQLIDFDRKVSASRRPRAGTLIGGTREYQPFDRCQIKTLKQRRAIAETQQTGGGAAADKRRDRRKTGRE